MRRVFISICLLICSYSSSSAWTHGSGFDLTGAKNFITDFGASCSGSGGAAADATALAAWNTYAAGNSPALSKLFVPPGSDCWFTTATTNPVINSGKNILIYGVGATFNDTNLTGLSTFQDANHDAKFTATANIGDTSVTINPADASKLTSNAWAVVTGLCFQTFGFPPNCQFWDHVFITNVSGSTVTFTPALTNQYLTTWPDLGSGCGSPSPCGGPGRISMMQPTWDFSATIVGLKFKRPSADPPSCSPSGSEITVIGRQFNFSGVTFDTTSCDDPGFGETMGTVVSSSIVGSPEVDKQIDLLTFNSSTGGLLINQSSAANVTVNNTTFSSGLNGTVKKTILSHATFGSFAHMGPWGYGHGVSLISDSTFIPSGVPQISIHSNAISWFSYSSGVLSIALTDPNIASVYAQWVPGQKYYFGASDCTDNSSPHSLFTVTAVTADVTNFKITTDMGGTEPTPTCNVVACSLFCAYAAATVTQTNLPPGAADLTVFAAP